MARSLFRCLTLACVGLAMVLLLGGCATTGDADNLSERPWNAPKSWENRLPTEMFEGR